MRALLPLLALPLASCAKLGSLPSLDEYTPKLAFDEVELGAVTWTGADADFLFTLSNPNPVKVTVASFTYDLDIDGKDLLAGDNADGIQLEAKGDSELRLPVSLQFADLVAAASSVSDDDTVPFTISGDFGFDTPLGRVTLPYEESGELPVLRTPTFALKAARVGSLDLLGSQSVELEIDLGVSNPGNANLGFSDLAYAIELSGSDVGSGKVASVGDVSGGASKTVTLPLEVKLVNLGSAIVSAITNKEQVQVGLSAEVDVDTPLGSLPLSFEKSKDLQLK